MRPLWASSPFSGVSKVRGRFNDVKADLVVGRTLDDTFVTATVDMSSIDTGNPDRDAHVKAADLLDIAARPTMAFRSTAISGAGSDWALDGDLTIGEVTRPVRFAVELGGTQDFFDGSRHAGFEATGEISRKAFGISLGALGAMVSDTVRIELDIQFVEPTTTPG